MRKFAEKVHLLRYAVIPTQTRLTLPSRKNLPVNIAHTSAQGYCAPGIPFAFFTPLFPKSRIADWTAHAPAQHADNRIVRLDAFYIGAKDLQYVSIESR